MVCPYCSHDSFVTNSRLQKRANNVWRRRQCRKCHSVWTTHETLDEATVFKVDHNGRLLDFQPETLLISLYEALRHRKNAPTGAQHVYKTILELLHDQKSPIITTMQITRNAETVLRRYDPLAGELYKTMHSSYFQ